MNFGIEIPPDGTFKEGERVGYIIGASILWQEKGGHSRCGRIEQCSSLVFEVMEEGEAAKEEREAPERIGLVGENEGEESREAKG